MNLVKRLFRYLGPSSGKTLANLLSSVASREPFLDLLRSHLRGSLRRIRKLERTLVVSDVNLGDAIIFQIPAEVLRYFFPETTIDYVCTAKAETLIRPNPTLSHIFPVFNRSFVPEQKEVDTLKALVRKNRYDLILNFCTFLPGGILDHTQSAVVSLAGLVAEVLKARNRGECANLSYCLNLFTNRVVYALPDSLLPRKPPCPFSGTRVYITAEALEERDSFLRERGFSPRSTLAMLNPDTSSHYTFLPRQLQHEILCQLASIENLDGVLLGSAFNFEGIEDELISRVPPASRKLFVIVPRSLSLPAFTALIDACELFITGDTGPLHLAVSRKIFADNNKPLRNRTAVVGIFGPTDPRIYGYDSSRREFSAGGQDAPARAFESHNSCRHIGCCVYKVTGACSRNTCFDGVPTEAITTFIRTYLETLSSTSPASPHLAQPERPEVRKWNPKAG